MTTQNAATAPTGTEDGLYDPFWSYTQRRDWYAKNCDLCIRRSSRNPQGKGDLCPIDLALLDFCDEGIAESIARRMGYLKPDGTTEGRDVWPCGEWEPFPGVAEAEGYPNLAAMMKALGRPLAPKPLKKHQMPLPYEAERETATR